MKRVNNACSLKAVNDEVPPACLAHYGPMPFGLQIELTMVEGPVGSAQSLSALILHNTHLATGSSFTFNFDSDSNNYTLTLIS